MMLAVVYRKECAKTFEKNDIKQLDLRHRRSILELSLLQAPKQIENQLTF